MIANSMSTTLFVLNTDRVFMIESEVRIIVFFCLLLVHIDWLREGDVTYRISIHSIMEQCIVSFELNQHVLCNSVLCTHRQKLN